MKKITNPVLLTVVALTFIAFFSWIAWEMKSEAVQPPSESREISKDTVSKIRIVAFGDSLTAGYNLPLDEAYPALLEQALTRRGENVEVINSGVSGETSAGGVRRAEFIRSLEPDIILFGLGGNDALRLLSPGALEGNLIAALEILRSGEKPPQVLLIGMRAPANADAAYRIAFDSVYPRLAKKYDVPFIPFFLEGVALDPAFTLADGIHPNKAGYETIVEKTLLPALLPLIEKHENK